MTAITTKAIVINSLKYRETSLIVKLYTEAEGLKSYMIKGVLKSKKSKFKVGYFQPLTLLQIEANHITNRTLYTLKEVQVSHAYQNLPFDIIKQSIVLFLSEILTYSIKEEETNGLLYNYLENSLLWLDNHNKITNFHLLFLLNLTKYLGIYPDVSLDDAVTFNLIQGKFSKSFNEKGSLSQKEFSVFKRILGVNFDDVESISFNKLERQIVLQVLIRYFELHLDGFKKPKSLEVLETVFK